MNEETPEEEKPTDPRRRLLGGLTDQQRYILYVLVAAGILVVLYMEFSSR